MAIKKRDPKKTDQPALNSESSHPARDFPIVGIGASAGGLAAFEAFFSGMPANTNPDMAFVLVQHLAPDHKSILTELIRHFTCMQVFEVEDGMVVQPNCAYIIPPNFDMAFINGTLQLLQPSAPRGQRLPIDFFFRSLAQDLHEKAICIVLSGTGSDGTQGVRAIKAEGGMAMAQNPESTEFDGMPRSAIATGLIDYEISPAEMPAQLIAYAAHAYGNPVRVSDTPAPKFENALKKIFVRLRDQTGHDFSQYKLSTINRRIERRMAVNQIDSIDGYTRYIQQSPIEVESLFRDLLIGVTSFFRDPDAFLVLKEQVIPKLFADKTAGETIRVWCAGCSTGEEAYSIAILLQEAMKMLKKSYKILIFATDIDRQAIAVARTGFYSSSIATDISPERLAEFFSLETDGLSYRIKKSIRDMLVFSEQDIILDPPFSRLDLISCRNLLIYMGGGLQRKLIPLFHYALNAGGALFLGTSETLGELDHLFSAIDRKAKLYRRKETDESLWEGMSKHYSSSVVPRDKVQQPRDRLALPAKRSLKELTEQNMINRDNLAGALINAHGDLLYLHGRTGAFLEPAPGESGINNILKMARKGLQVELANALRKAVTTNETIFSPGLHIKDKSRIVTVNMIVCPVAPDSTEINDSQLYLVVLEEMPENVNSLDRAITINGLPDNDARIAALQKELITKDEYLQSANEELQTINEELKSSNEELQSVNEEMQSTNEELETSKEELQSMNEELTTVNTELQNNVADLSRVNNDMNNLVAGTGIGTVFVNHQLQILRFTPSATRIINLIASDVGRPITHIATNLTSYNCLAPDIQAVLDTLTAKEIELPTTDDRWYSMRIQPYRTLDNVIEGAVLTFVDISSTVQARQVLKQANDLLRLAVVVRDSHDAITVQSMDGRIMAWNPSACRMYGWLEAEALQMNVRDRIPKDHKNDEMAILYKLTQSEVIEPYRTQRTAKNGAVLNVWVTATALQDEAGQIYAIATTEREAK